MLTVKTVTVNPNSDNISRVSEDCKVLGVNMVEDDIILCLADSEDKAKTKMIEIFTIMDGDTITEDDIKTLTFIGTVVATDEDEHIFLNVFYRYV